MERKVVGRRITKEGSVIGKVRSLTTPVTSIF